MRQPLMLVSAALLLSLGACSGGGTDAEVPARPATQPATTTASTPAASDSAVGTRSPSPAPAPATTPSMGTAPSSGTTRAVPPVTPSASDSSSTRAGTGGQLYYISVGDGGPLGCGDTAVGAVELPRSQTPVRNAMTRLLADHSAREPMLGLENPLGRSRLRYVDGRYDEASGVVTVWLTGTLAQSGSCDDPRLEAQLEMTAKSAAGARQARIIINGRPLEDHLDMRG